MPKTSLTDPLLIDVVDAPHWGGQIGMTLCPGRRDSLSLNGAWERDLAADLDVVCAWGPALVLTLVEDFEFARLGVPTFRTAVLERSLEWRHLPIPDAGVPDASFEGAWRSVGEEVRAALRRGGRVLLHCRAGLGRTGMLAARILTELGMEPKAAIRAVRAARPGTIETAAQERHVLACRPQAARGCADALRDRIRGSLLGAAIGDALGSAFEFVSSAEIARAIGGSVAREYCSALPKSLMNRRASGIPTDDTAMTLALVAALVQPPPLTPASVFERLVAELRRGTGRFGELFWNGGPGGACSAMLRVAASGAAPFEGLDPNAGGNGAAMRAHPCGAFSDRAYVSELATMQARLSHPHPGAVAAAVTVALVVHEGIHTGQLAAALPPEIADTRMIAAWERAHRDLRRGDALPPHLRDVDMAGWNTVAAAHAIAQLYAGDPETAIGIAAASGGDTDTVASIVGAMLGAVHGARALPERWIAGLAFREEVEAAADALYQAVRA